MKNGEKKAPAKKLPKSFVKAMEKYFPQGATITPHKGPAKKK